MKRVLSVLLVFTLILAMLPVSIFTASAEASGDYTYEYTDSGIMITGYTGSGGNVSIPGKIDGNTVTGVGENVFINRKDLTTIAIPNSVKYIKDHAFYSCTGLIGIAIPDSVITVGSYAFAYCTNMKEIIIGSNVTDIGQSAFTGCKALKNVAIPSSVTAIQQNLFSDCTGMSNVSLPESITSIGIGAFSGCSELTSITIPNKVTSISEKAFYNCSKLTSIIMPDGVSSIGKNAFSGCKVLYGVIIPNSAKSIGESAFTGCMRIANITIPKSVKTIEKNAFSGCVGLSTVLFICNAPAMGTDVFLNCNSALSIYYYGDCTGFTDPWYGYKTTCFSPKISLSSTAPTNGNVTVSIAYPSNAVKKEYRTNSSEWADYTGPILLKNNDTVYVRCTNTVTNTTFAETSVIVSNIDKEAPDPPTFAASTNKPTNDKVAISIFYPVDAAKCEYSLNSSEWLTYSSPVILQANGAVYARCKDTAGNLSVINCIVIGNIDKEAPSAPTFSASSYQPVNGDVIITINYSGDAINQQYKIGGGNWIIYANPITLTNNDTVFAKCEDAVGNISAISSYDVSNIDREAPLVTGVTNNTLYNSNKTVAFNEGAATLNGIAFTSGASVSTDGVYTLIVTDAAGNATTVVFTIDKTAPVVTGAVNNGSYNTDRIITINEGTAVLNGDAFASGTILTAEGLYTLVVTDAAGNVTTVAFTIDKTAPAAPVLTPSTSGPTNKDITVAITAESNAAIQYSTDGKTWNSYTKPITVTANGTVIAKAIDLAGNTSVSGSLVISNMDKTAPIVTGVANNSSYSTSKTITFNEGTAALNGTAFTSGTAVSADGSYTLVVTDVSGNVTTVAFSIDITAPVVTGVADNGLYKADKTIAFNEGTAKLNGNAFSNGATVSTDGIYTLVITDAAGNVTTVLFTIDKTAPVVTGAANNGIYNASKTITYNEGTAALNGTTFISGTAVSVEGAYTLVVTDMAGNITTVAFTIDKTAPVVMGVSNSGIYNTSKTITFNEGTSKLNGIAFSSGATISADSIYNLVVTDSAGNITTVAFTIDKTAPVVTGVTNSVVYNTSKTITLNEGTAVLNGNSFKSGTAVSIEGTYTLVVTDAAGNVTTVMFTIDKTAPAAPVLTPSTIDPTNKDITVTITAEENAAIQYSTDGKTWNSYTKPIAVTANGTVLAKAIDLAGNTSVNGSLAISNIDKTAPVVTGVTNNAFYSTSKTITFNDGTAAVNGNAVTSGTAVSSEGTYTLVVTDAVGNVTTVVFTIDKTAPVAPVLTPSTIDPTNKDITVTITAEENAAIQYSTDGKTWNSYTKPITVTENGTVLAKAIDLAGNTSVNSSLTISNMDKTAPVVTGVVNNGTYTVSKNITFTEGTALLDGNTFASGTAVSANGIHTLIVTDSVGNITTVKFTISIPIPVTGIILSSNNLKWVVGNSGTINVTVNPGNATNKAVSWSSNNTKVATVDSSGKVKAIGAGTAVITCTSKDGSNKKATCSITVTKPVTSIKLNATTLTLKTGTSGALTVTINPTDATNKTVGWSSSNTAVATVDSKGKVTAKGIGKATITCTAQDGSNKKATCEITVIPAAPTGVKAVKASSTSIKLTWAKVSGVTGYEVYRSTSKAGTYTKVKTLTGTSFTDTGLTKGKTYYYKIVAYKTVGSTPYKSGYSVIVSSVL